MHFIKEFVREEIKNRNGKRVVEVTGALYATLDPEDGTLLISYAKLHRDLDQPCKNFQNTMLEDRAQVWKYRLANDKAVFYKGQITFIRKVGEDIISEKRIPYAVTQVLPLFIRRAQRYFQGAPLVSWAVQVLEAFPTVEVLPSWTLTFKGE